MRNYLFELKEGLIISFKAIRANKVRSVLTTVGIVIGVLSVVLMSTAITGIDVLFQKGVSSMGSDNLYIHKWSWGNNEIPWWEMRNRPHVVMDEYKRFKDMAKLPFAIAPEAGTNRSMKYKDNELDAASISGTTFDYARTTNFVYAEGRFFSEIESNGARNVCVVGSEIAKNLFPDGRGLNKIIKIGGVKFKVVGVLEELGSWAMGNFNPDNRVFIPIHALFKYFYSESRGGILINVRAENSQMVPATKEEAISIMRRIRGLKYNEPDNFAINQQEALLSQIDATVGVIQVAGFLITGMALFVGAIGIMNIMFVSVKERTREIGIRKAIGAKKRSILGQFISEAAVICLLGGFIGLALAFLGTMIIRQQGFMIYVEADSVILAITISIITGILSGFAPAYSAAKMDPVEALRYE
jgi:putative ABC transport system permease protein